MRLEFMPEVAASGVADVGDWEAIVEEAIVEEAMVEETMVEETMVEETMVEEAMVDEAMNRRGHIGGCHRRRLHILSGRRLG